MIYESMYVLYPVQNFSNTDLQVNSIAQVHSGNDTSKDVWADLFHYTFDLTRSNNAYDRFGACAAIGKAHCPRLARN
jgi:hypothetical protein